MSVLKNIFFFCDFVEDTNEDNVARGFLTKSEPVQNSRDCINEDFLKGIANKCSCPITFRWCAFFVGEIIDGVTKTSYLFAFASSQLTFMNDISDSEKKPLNALTQS